MDKDGAEQQSVDTPPNTIESIQQQEPSLSTSTPTSTQSEPTRSNFFNTLHTSFSPENNTNENPRTVSHNDIKSTETETESHPATSTFISEVSQLIPEHLIDQILETQANTFKTFKEANYTLSSFNEFSSMMLTVLTPEYEKHTKTLKDMKKDLENVFKRIRNLQALLKQKFPEAEI